MERAGYRRGGARHRFQAYNRMRIPPMLLPHVRQVHIIGAIRHSREVDDDDLYGKALSDLTHGDNETVLNEVAALMEGVVTEKLKGREVDAALQTYSSLYRIDQDDSAYPNIILFNQRFLNGKGLTALVTVLICDAAELDVAAIDLFKGGANLEAAYGARNTRRSRRAGKEFQTLLKNFTAVDEDATREAAGRYIEYRFLDHGNFSDYLRRAELAGNPRSERHLRQRFREFDDALGFPRPTRGRPKERG